MVWCMTAECVSTTDSTWASCTRWRAEGEDGPGTREGPAFELLEAPVQLRPACGGGGAQGRVSGELTEHAWVRSLHTLWMGHARGRLGWARRRILTEGALCSETNLTSGLGVPLSPLSSLMSFLAGDPRSLRNLRP